jgi:hypothetical protein
MKNPANKEYLMKLTQTFNVSLPQLLDTQCFAVLSEKNKNAKFQPNIGINKDHTGTSKTKLLSSL